MESPSSSSEDEDGELIGNAAEEPREVPEGDLRHQQLEEMTWNSGGHGASPSEKQQVANAEEAVSMS